MSCARSMLDKLWGKHRFPSHLFLAIDLQDLFPLTNFCNNAKTLILMCFKHKTAAYITHISGKFFSELCQQQLRFNATKKLLLMAAIRNTSATRLLEQVRGRELNWRQF